MNTQKNTYVEILNEKIFVRTHTYRQTVTRMGTSIIQGTGNCNEHPLAFLLSKDFLEEIHHLLWMDLSECNGTNDQGWSCRDHALLIGNLILFSGFNATVMSGKCMLIQGGNSLLPTICLEVEPHSFVGMNKHILYDASPRFHHMVISENKDVLDWPLSCVCSHSFANECTYNIKTTITEHAYQEAIKEAAQQHEQRTLIYLIKKKVSVDIQHLFEPLQTINSPLAHHLLSRLHLTRDIYVKAVNFLLNFVRNETPSLRNYSRDEAWKIIASTNHER
ncbi:MAG: hypothetical protein KGZ58_04035 [Ignavibacteriales bacterium]|nr:hypothetical protein [Ignavibacteriales bacterium]